MLGYLGIIVAILTAFIPFGFQYFKAEIRDDASYRERVAEALTDHSYLQAYRRNLGHALSFLADVMGDLYCLRGALRMLAICYVIAMGYSALYFFISWALGGPEAIGDLKIFPSIPIWQRLIWLIVFVISLAIFAKALVNIIASAKGDKEKNIRNNFRKGFLTAFFCVSFVAAIAGSAPTTRAFLYIVIFIFSICVTFSIIRFRKIRATFYESRFLLLLISGIALIFALAGVGVGAAIQIAFGNLDPGRDKTEIIPHALFLAILPLANTLLDWPSWWVSRWLGHHLLQQAVRLKANFQKAIVIALHIAIDLLFAVSLLMLLAIALPYFVELAVLGFGSLGHTMSLDLNEFIASAARHPWPNGIWIVLMLTSTLIPTLLHAGILIASPLAFWLIPDNERHAMRMGLTVHQLPNPSAVRYAAWHQVRFWLIATAAPLALVTIVAYSVSSFIDTLLQHLVKAAYFGIALAHQHAVLLGSLGRF